MTVRDRQGILVLGRALHAPWNEGTRMITRNLAEAAGELRPTHVISLTQTDFASSQESGAPVQHVASRLRYGAVSEWLALPGIATRARRTASGAGVGVAHLVGLPLALAPAVRTRGPRVVAHVTMVEHVYASRIDRFRAAAAWRVFDPWIDAYAASSQPVR